MAFSFTDHVRQMKGEPEDRVDPVNWSAPKISKSNPHITKLSPTDLLQNEEYLSDIKAHMEDRYGVGYSERYSDKEIMDMFINKQRRFNAGQSVVTLGETAWLAKADEERRERAAKAYSHFDKLGNIFGEQNTFSEKMDGVFDYARAAIIDPVNLISFGIGRLAAGAGIKTAARMARATALSKYDEAIAAGKGIKEAEKIQKTHLNTLMQGVTSNASFNSRAKKEIAAATAADTALAIGVDIAYQNGMIMSMQQKDYSGIQTSLMALTGLVGGGLSTASILRRKRTQAQEGALSGIEETYLSQKAKALRKTARGLKRDMEKLYDIRKPKKKISQKDEKVQRGAAQSTITMDEDEFFSNFLWGIPSKGIKGFVRNLYDNGVIWEGKRYDGDGVTNWLADVISGSGDIRAFGQVYAAMEDIIGKNGKNLKQGDATLNIPNYNDELMELAKTKGIKAEELSEQEKLQFFADRLMLSVHKKGTFFQKLGQTAKVLQAKGKLDNMTAEQFEEDFFGELPDQTIKDKVLNVTNWVQNLTIRNIVTHPGTTALNLTGWSAYSTLQSTTDVTKAILFSPFVALQKLSGREGADEKAKYLRNLVALQGRKARNILDSDTTFEEFKSYTVMREGVGNKLFRSLAGGVETVPDHLVGTKAGEALDQWNKNKQKKMFIDQFGFDPSERMIPRNMERYTKFFQTVYGVKAQDLLTKSVEFMYNIEKGIMKKYGKTYLEFMDTKKTPDLFKIMSGEEYLKLEAKAVDDTLKSTFNKRYGEGRYDFTSAPIRSFAKAVEDFRKIPVLGLTMPFGQFFNNTIAFMTDFSPLGAGKGIYKLFQKGVDKEDAADAMIKGAIGTTAIGAFAYKEIPNMEEGLAWYEERETLTGGLGTGVVRSRQYDYPYSAFKMAGRMVAHRAKGESIPKELITTAYETFGLGQATRQLGAYETGVKKFIQALASGELELAAESAIKIMGSSASQMLSGLSRPMDVPNMIVAQARADKYKNFDRRQGVKVFNDSVRYVDQIFSALGFEIAPEKNRPLTKEKAVTPIGRLVGFREVPKHSNIEKMFNMVGRPQWRAGFYSNVEEADNRLNEVVFKHLEKEADRLVHLKGFAKLRQDRKLALVAETINSAKKKAKQELQGSIVYKDRRLVTMQSIDRNNTRLQIAKALDLMGISSMDDMDTRQLLMLEELLAQEKRAARKMIKGGDPIY